jgi:hypothetical protein
MPRPGLFLPVRRDPLGVTGPTPKSARGPLWRQSSHGWYVPARVARTTEQRIVEASAVLPAFGGVTGWAGLRWAGGAWFGGQAARGLERPVWLATGGCDVRQQPGIAVSAERLDPVLLTTLDGVPITVPVRSADFEMRYSEDLWAAVEVMDMAAYSDLVSIAEAWAYATAHPGWTGIGQERAAISLADENSWSPQETWSRLVWGLLAELPPVLCNHPLFDRQGNFIGTPDLIDEEAGVLVEYKGLVHLDKARWGADVKREAAFRGHGLVIVDVVAADRASPSALAARMHAARERAAFAAPSTRSWTLEPPHWWRPTHTVDLRRAIEPAERARLLRYRVA